MQNQNVPKPTRKGELKDLLKGYNEKTVTAEIIDVVKTTRNVSIKEARDIKTLRPLEVAEVLRRFS